MPTYGEFWKKAVFVFPYQEICRMCRKMSRVLQSIPRGTVEKMIITVFWDVMWGSHVFFAMQCHTPEGSNLHNYCSENFKSGLFKGYLKKISQQLEECLNCDGFYLEYILQASVYIVKMIHWCTKAFRTALCCGLFFMGPTPHLQKNIARILIPHLFWFMYLM
jgi:hypothetical protein